MDNGPRVVFSSIGSPAFRAASAAWNFSRNLSASLSTTMNRLAAQQVCPVLYIRPQTAHLMVWSRSASSSTMNASLPPSSIEDDLEVLVRPAPRCSGPPRRCRSAPTPLIRGSSTTDPTARARSAGWCTARPGAPASIHSFSNAIAHCGTMPACFTTRTLPAIRCGPATRAS